MRPSSWHALLVFAAVALFSALLRFVWHPSSSGAWHDVWLDAAIAPATWLVARELVGASWAGAAALLAGTSGLHVRATAADAASALDALLLALGWAATLRARRSARLVERAAAVVLSVWSLARGVLGLAVLAPNVTGGHGHGHGDDDDDDGDERGGRGERTVRLTRGLTFAVAVLVVLGLHPTSTLAFDATTIGARAAEFGGESWLAALGAFGLALALLGLVEPAEAAALRGLPSASVIALGASFCDSREFASAALVPLAAVWAVLGLRWTLGRFERASVNRAWRWTFGFVFVTAALLPPLGLALRQALMLARAAVP
ncbi:MAG: hypothetical protein L6Q99_06850 [Planctomycetes bacterium]|nr:hypothetical protein [Planctomycetota bacterium]